MISGQVPVLSEDPIRPRANAGSRRIDVRRHWSGETALKRHNGRQLPAVERLFSDAVQPPSEWQIVEHRLHESLRHVEAAGRAISPHVINILRSADEIAAAHLAANIRRSRDGVRIRVGRQEDQAGREPPLGLHLERVVNRVADRLVGAHVALVCLVGTARV